MSHISNGNYKLLLIYKTEPQSEIYCHEKR